MIRWTGVFNCPTVAPACDRGFKICDYPIMGIFRKYEIEYLYGPSDPYSTHPFQCDPSFYQPVPYRLLLKWHILCTFPCAFIIKLKRKHVRTTHIDFNEGINDYLISKLLELVCRQKYSGREMNYQTTSESNRKESNKRCSLLLLTYVSYE